MAFGLPQKKRRTPPHHTESQRKSTVHEKTAAHIGECIGKLGLGRKDEAETLFFDTVRLFFADFIPIHYKFTHDEVKLELEKKHLTDQLRERSDQFLDKMSEAEYHPEGVGPEQLHALILSFAQIVELLKAELLEMPAKEHPKASAPWEAAISSVIHPSHIQQAPQPEEQELKEIIKQGEQALAQHDKQRGREAYAQMTEVFNRLSEERKGLFYQKVITFYNELVAMS